MNRNWLQAILLFISFVFVNAPGGMVIHAAPEAPWPMLGHDAGRTHYSSIMGIENPGAAPIFLEGQEPFDDSAEGDMLVAAGDILLLRDGYYKGEYTAFNPQTGEVLWHFPRTMFCTPAVGSDGILYTYGTEGQPVALDSATGDVLWEDTEVAPRTIWNTNNNILIDASGQVYFPLDDGIAVYAPGAARQLRWSYFDTLTDMIQYPDLFSVGPDGTIYMFSDASGQRLIAFKQSGTGATIKWYYSCAKYLPPSEQWSEESPVTVIPIIGPDGTIFLRFRHTVAALQDTGAAAEELWTKSIEGDADTSGDSPILPVLDSSGYLYVWSDRDGALTITCLDTNDDGATVWAQELPDARAINFMGAGDRLYILGGSSAIGGLNILDMGDGGILSVLDYVGNPGGEMAIASDGTIYYTATYYARDGHNFKNHTIIAIGETSNHPPAITQLSANPQEGTAPLEVDFSAAASDPDSDPLTYQWDFGDGQTGTGRNPTHTFDEPGVYEVELTVTDANGASTTQTIEITVYEEIGPGEDVTLSIAISAQPRYGQPPLAVNFEATPDPLIANLSYTWNFDDGSTGTGRSVAHTFDAAGMYVVTVSAGDNSGHTAAARVVINVLAEGRQLLAAGCVTIMADSMACDNDVCTLSGNVLLNGFLVCSSPVVVDGTTITGDGDLYVATEDGDTIDVLAGGFTIAADAEDDNGTCYGDIWQDSDFTFNLYGFEVEYDGVRLYEDYVKVGGRMQLPVDFGQVQVSYTISVNGLDFAGRIDLPDIQISGFGVKDGYMELDTALLLWAIGATLKVPGMGFELGAELGFLGGYFNMIKVEVGDLNKPILFSPPPPVPIVFLQSVSGGLENISPEATDPVIFSAGAGFSGGPKVTLPTLNLLNGTLKVGGCGEGCEILGGDIDLEIDTGGRFTAEGTGYLISSDFGTFGSLVLILDIAKGVYFEGNLYYPPGQNFAILIVTGKGKIDFGLNFQASLQGTLRTPDAWWFIGGKTFGSAKTYIDNDLLAAGVQIGDRICIPLLGCANLFIKASVTFSFDDGDFEIAKNWNSIGEVQFRTGSLRTFGSALAAPANTGSHRFDVSEDADVLIFRMEAAGDQAEFSLEGPDKTVYDERSENAYWSRNDEIGELWCAVPNPARGAWTMTITSSAKDYTLQMLKQNAEPSIEITSPGIDQVVERGGAVQIAWTAEDTDDDARISLFFDEDREGANGNMIVSGLSEESLKASYAWDTSDVAPGRYYVYAKIDDNKNFPVFAYSTAAVIVKRTDFPPPVLKAVAQGPEGLALAWDAVAGADGYRVYYRPAHENRPLQEGKALAVWSQTDAVLRHLAWGTTYRVAVTAFTQAGDESDLSAPVEAVMTNQAGNNAPVITSKPVTVARVGAAYTYKIAASDFDSNLLSYELRTGPEGLAVAASGEVSWTPSPGSEGVHAVELKVSDTDNGSAVQSYSLQVLSKAEGVAPPAVDIEYSSDIGAAPLTVSFKAVAWEVNAEQLGYLWDFGDGTSSEEQAPQHTFAAKGQYTVILTVTSASGLSSSKTVIIQAAESVPLLSPPQASASVSQASVAMSFSSNVVAKGYRFYLGSTQNNIDYDKPVDLGAAENITFANVPVGRYTIVSRAYLSEFGETWNSEKTSFSVAAPGSQAGAALTGVVEGVVSDNQTGSPIAGATVRFIFYATKTDAEGRFRFENLPALKKAYVTAVAAGYAEATAAVSVTLDNSTACALKLNPSGSGGQDGCPAEQLVPAKAGLLRLLRDQVLEKTADGRQCRALYYRHAPEVLQILGRDKSLRAEAARLIMDAAPWMTRMSKGGRVYLPAHLRGRVAACIQRLSSNAGPELQAALEHVSRYIESLLRQNALIQ